MKSISKVTKHPKNGIRTDISLLNQIKIDFNEKSASQSRVPKTSK